MFDIPELDDLIYLRVPRKTLLQCVQVSRMWYHIVTPYIWYELTVTGNSRTIKRENFCRLVVEDFLHERWQERVYESREHLYRPSRPLKSPFSSDLTKYGRWIRQVSEPRELFGCLSHWPSERRLRLSKSDMPEPTDLLHHFYKRCPRALRLDTMNIDPLDFKTNLWKMISDLLVLRLRHLVIKGPRYAPYDPSKLKCVLDRLSATMETLTLDSDSGYVQDTNHTTEMKSWKSLKKLRVLKGFYTAPSPPSAGIFSPNINTNMFWSWLWTRCHHVESIEVSWISEGGAKNLTEAMQTHMPNLTKIQFGDSQRRFRCTDRVLATLLSGSRKGWTMVDVSWNTNIGQDLFDALTNHFLTLQELRMTNCTISGEGVVKVLSSCPNLRALVAIDNRTCSKRGCLKIAAETFIDQYPHTGGLRTWSCENSLKVLKVKIGNIPRPDMWELIKLSHVGHMPRLDSSGSTIIHKEMYPGEGRERQEGVYARLGRLVKLETLWLGHEPEEIYEEPNYNDRYFQLDSLDMSLESGLGSLSGLKALRELNVSRMCMAGRPQDAQWMVENWPKLLTIYGIDSEANVGNVFAATLLESSPRLKLPKVRNPVRESQLI